MKMGEKAVSEIIGAIVLLAMAVAVFSVIYINVLADDGPNPNTFVTIVGKIENNDVVFEHEIGESLGLDTRVILYIGNQNKPFIDSYIDEYLLDTDNLDLESKNVWNIGERLTNFSKGFDISKDYIKGYIFNEKNDFQSLVWWGILQEGKIYNQLGAIWKLDEGSDHIARDSLNDNHGYVVGRPNWQTAANSHQGESCLFFSGSKNRYVHVPGNRLSLDIRDNLTLDAWIQIPDDIFSSLSYSDDFGFEPNIIQISEEIYAVVFRNQSDDGTLQTVRITEEGYADLNIKNSTYHFETNKCYWPRIIHVYDDIYVVGYQDKETLSEDSLGHLQTIQIFKNGEVNYSFESSHYDFGPKEVYDIDLIYINDDIFAITYRNETDKDADGFIKTFQITNNGKIIKPVPGVNNSKILEEENCYKPRIIKVINDIYAVTYRGKNGDGCLKTIKIEDNGNIDTVNPRYEFDTKNDSYQPEIINITNNIYAIVYRDRVNVNNLRGLLATVEINNQGEIGPVKDTLIFEQYYCEYPSVCKIDDNEIAIAYQSEKDAKVGYVITVTIDDYGIINKNLPQPLIYNILPEHSNYFAFTPDIIKIYDNIVAIAFETGSHVGNPHSGDIVILRIGDDSLIPLSERGIYKENTYGIFLNRTIIYMMFQGIIYSENINIGSEWNHIVLTYDGLEVRLYLNDTLIKSFPYTGLINSNTNDIYIGKSFYGRIDYIQLLNKVYMPG